MDDADEVFDTIFVVVVSSVGESVGAIGSSVFAIGFLLGDAVLLVGTFVGIFDGIFVGMFVGILEGLLVLNIVVIVSDGSVGCISTVVRMGKLGLKVIISNIESVGTLVGGILFIGVGALENAFQEN